MNFHGDGLVEPIDKHTFAVKHALSSEFIVEWRALTVMMLDQLAWQIRFKLGLVFPDFIIHLRIRLSE